MAFSFLLKKYNPFPLRKGGPFLLVAYKNSENLRDHVQEIPDAARTLDSAIGNRLIYLDEIPGYKGNLCFDLEKEIVPVHEETFEEALGMLL